MLFTWRLGEGRDVVPRAGDCGSSPYLDVIAASIALKVMLQKGLEKLRRTLVPITVLVIVPAVLGSDTGDGRVLVGSAGQETQRAPRPDPP